MKYYITTQKTFTERFIVEADNEKDAQTLVKAGKVVRDGCATGNDRIVASWPLADQTLPAGNIE